MQKVLPIGFFICCFFVTAFIPLDQQNNYWAWPVLFALKLCVVFSFLFICLWGIGRSINHLFCILRKVLTPIYNPKMEATYSEELIFTFFLVLLGIVVVGVSQFIGGLFWPPQALHAVLLMSWGFFSFFYFRGEFVSRVARGLEHFRLFHKTLQKDRWLLSFFYLVVTAFLLRFFVIFDFQNHGDAFLYHLSLAETWMFLGKTGLTLDNITSGYSYAIEHFYLFLKLFISGNAEQNALAQMFQGIVGYGSFLLVCNTLLKQVTPIFFRLVFLLIFLKPDFLSFCLYPKSDAFVLAAVFFTLYGFWTRNYFLFFAATFVAGSIKITTTFNLLALGLSFIIYDSLKAKRFSRETFWLFLTAALFTLLGLSPFFINNALITGNPLFPLANDFFKSPFGPLKSQAIVGEMQPFHLSLWELCTSFKNLFLEQPFNIAVLLSAVVVLGYIKRTSIKEFLTSNRASFFLIFFVIDFILLLFFLGPYGHLIHTRHFLIPISGLYLLNIMLLAKILGGASPRLRKICIAVLGIYSLTLSNLDVAAVNAYKFLSKSQLTQDFFMRKPLIALNNEISQDKTIAITSPILVISIENTGYFLENARMWHRTLSYPVLFWDYENMDKDDWLRSLKLYHIQYLIISDDSFNRYPALKSLGLKSLLSKQNYHFYRLLSN